MLVAMEMLIAMVLRCHSPCELWGLDAIHHANGNGLSHPLMLVLTLMLLVLGMLMAMVMLMLIAMVIAHGNVHGAGNGHSPFDL